MVSTFLVLMLTTSSVGQSSSEINPGSVVSVLESLQSSMRDFRCEYEGTIRFTTDDARKNLKLADDGLHDTYSGVFIWRTGGDIYDNSLHRFEPDGKILRQQLVVRMWEGEAEMYLRPDDSPIGRGSTDDPNFLNADRSGSLGSIFVIDTIKRLAANPDIELSVSDDQLDGRNLLVVTATFKGPNQVYQRFWFDLQRGGHAVRRETYAAGDELMGRAEIKLAPFEINSTEVWMPVSGVIHSHSSSKDGRPYFPKEPTSIETLYIVNGSLEFNQLPGPTTFEVDYKPGTPISDNLRQLQYEFGQQEVVTQPSKLEAEAMLREQLAEAETQRTELEASSPARKRFDWTTWLAWGFGATALITSIALVLQRRQR